MEPTMAPKPRRVAESASAGAGGLAALLIAVTQASPAIAAAITLGVGLVAAGATKFYDYLRTHGGLAGIWREIRSGSGGPPAAAA